VLTYSQVAVKSLKVTGVLLIFDFLGVFLLHDYVYPYEVLGDLLLIETAALFLAAGIIDFGSSLGFLQFRRTMSPSTKRFPVSKRKDSERHALVLVFSGSILFGVLVLLAICKH
jgi:hypothetical protein